MGVDVQTLVITGCTTGTGLAAARAVAKKGGDVIMLNRASTRAEVAESLVSANRARSMPISAVPTLPGGREISLPPLLWGKTHSNGGRLRQREAEASTAHREREESRVKRVWCGVARLCCRSCTRTGLASDSHRGGVVCCWLGGYAAAQVKEVAAEGATWGARVQTIECDLSQFRSVLAAAADVRLACPNGIDVLCCNAGVMALPDSIVTADGCAFLPPTPPPLPLSFGAAAAPGARPLESAAPAEAWHTTVLRAGGRMVLMCAVGSERASAGTICR